MLTNRLQLHLSSLCPLHQMEMIAVLESMKPLTSLIIFPQGVLLQMQPRFTLSINCNPYCNCEYLWSCSIGGDTRMIHIHTSQNCDSSQPDVTVFFFFLFSFKWKIFNHISLIRWLTDGQLLWWDFI